MSYGYLCSDYEGSADFVLIGVCVLGEISMGEMHC